MKKFRENIGTVTLVAIIIFLLIWKFGCGNSAPGTGQNPDSLFYWKTKDSINVASLKAVENDFAVMQKEFTDSIANIYKSKTKFIKEFVIIDQQTDADVKPSGPVERDYWPVERPDCPPVIKNMKQVFESKFYKATVQIGDSSYMNLKSFDQVTVLWKRVREGSFLKRRWYLQLDVSNSNPDVKITGLTSYRVAEKKPKQWGIGLQAGYGFQWKQNGWKPQPYIGIGITKTIIRF